MSAGFWDEDEVAGDGDAVLVPCPSAPALFEVLAVVLEARVAAGLGDGGRAGRCVERAAELLLELLP